MKFYFHRLLSALIPNKWYYSVVSFVRTIPSVPESDRIGLSARGLAIFNQRKYASFNELFPENLKFITAGEDFHLALKQVADILF